MVKKYLAQIAQQFAKTCYTLEHFITIWAEQHSFAQLLIKTRALHPLNSVYTHFEVEPCVCSTHLRSRTYPYVLVLLSCSKDRLDSTYVVLAHCMLEHLTELLHCASMLDVEVENLLEEWGMTELLKPFEGNFNSLCRYVFQIHPFNNLK